MPPVDIITVIDATGVQREIYTNSLLMLMVGGADSNNAPLPANFTSLPMDLSDRDDQGYLLSASVTNGLSTWTQEYTRDAEGNVTSVSAWVAS